MKSWRESGGFVDWVGEWHSHIEPDPSPSRLDQRTWRRQTNRTRAALAYFIVGTHTNWVGVLEANRRIPEKTTVTESSDEHILFS